MPAAEAIARIVARSYPSAANRSRAAVTDGRPGAVGAPRPCVDGHANDRRPTAVDLPGPGIAWSTAVGQQSLAWRRGGVMGTQDVVLVGAGPTGLLLAGDLAAAGVPVTVLERRPEQENNLTRAFAVHARTLEVLDARGLADELSRGARRVERGAVPATAPGRPRRRCRPASRSCSSPRSTRSSACSRSARSKQGARILRGVAVEGLRRTPTASRSPRARGTTAPATSSARTGCTARCDSRSACRSPDARWRAR